MESSLHNIQKLPYFFSDSARIAIKIIYHKTKSISSAIVAADITSVRSNAIDIAILHSNVIDYG